MKGDKAAISDTELTVFFYSIHSMSSHPTPEDNSPESHKDQQLELGEDESLTSLRRAWERTLRAMAGKLNRQTIDNWLRPLKPLSLNSAIVVLGAPSSFAREFAEKKYSQTLAQHLAQYLDMPSVQVRFVISTPELQPIMGEKPLSLQQASQPIPAAVPSLNGTRSEGIRNSFSLELAASPLNSRHTFENFVVGKSNRLAHAGAQAVASAPGSIYNPLFLYGSPGLGKTHLMHAIGHEIRQALPQARVAYVSGEMFTNHYVAAIRDKRTEDFRRAYRNVDVWLVDDIQTLASKEQTKEEFFHTFNVLHQMNKQIVLTSDRSPRELKAMDERLWSRFECGLVADIAPPELEMRQAILQKKALLESMHISDDVIAFMANLIQSNIRALEGAMIKLMAIASLTCSPVTKQLASDVLTGYFVDRPPSREPISAHPEDHGLSPIAQTISTAQYPVRVGVAGHGVDRIIRAVASQTGVDVEAILAGGGRSHRASRLSGDAGFARQVAMYLAKEMGGVPMTTLASAFGLKSHTAIAHAHTRLQKELADDPQILSLISRIRQEVERGG